MKKRKKMGLNNSFSKLDKSTIKIQYAVTYAATPPAYQPQAVTSRLRRRSPEEIKAKRVTAYKYLIP